MTIGLAAAVGAPAALLGASDTVRMMSVGAALSLLAVLGGWACARLAFRGPDRYAVKLVVGGFVIRLAFLLAATWGFVSVTGLDPARFVLWVVAFYFALVLVEAWIMARAEMRGEGSV